MFNLMQNAYKYGREGGKIRVSLCRENGCAVISVKDDGPGIASDDLPYIFDRFYKADKAHSGKGTGLGLSIVKKILEQHGQEIKCTSTPGRGTSFMFTLAKYTPELEKKQAEKAPAQADGAN